MRKKISYSAFLTQKLAEWASYGDDENWYRLFSAIQDSLIQEIYRAVEEQKGRIKKLEQEI
jgi:hypothetical protein